MAYLAELRSAVDKNLERFLKSCIFYFLRNTKGEMTGLYSENRVKCV